LVGHLVSAGASFVEHLEHLVVLAGQEALRLGEPQAVTAGEAFYREPGNRENGVAAGDGGAVHEDLAALGAERVRGPVGGELISPCEKAGGQPWIGFHAFDASVGHATASSR